MVQAMALVLHTEAVSVRVWQIFLKSREVAILFIGYLEYLGRVAMFFFVSSGLLFRRDPIILSTSNNISFRPAGSFVQWYFSVFLTKIYITTAKGDVYNDIVRIW